MAKEKIAWNKGLKLSPLSEAHKHKISESVKKNPNIKRTQFKKGHKINLGKKYSLEHRNNLKFF